MDNLNEQLRQAYNAGRRQELNEQLGRILFRGIRKIMDAGGGGPIHGPNDMPGRFRGQVTPGGDNVDEFGAFAVNRFDRDFMDQLFNLLPEDILQEIMGNGPPEWWLRANGIKPDHGMYAWLDSLIEFQSAISDLLDEATTSIQHVNMIREFLEWMSSPQILSSDPEVVVRSLMEMIQSMQSQSVNTIFGPNGPLTIVNTDGVIHFSHNPGFDGDIADYGGQSFYNILWTILQFINGMNIPYA